MAGGASPSGGDGDKGGGGAGCVDERSSPCFVSDCELLPPLTVWLPLALGAIQLQIFHTNRFTDCHFSQIVIFHLEGWTTIGLRRLAFYRLFDL
jgi:hypothetical protein